MQYPFLDVCSDKNNFSVLGHSTQDGRNAICDSAPTSLSLSLSQARKHGIGKIGAPARSKYRQSDSSPRSTQMGQSDISFGFSILHPGGKTEEEDEPSPKVLRRDYTGAEAGLPVCRSELCERTNVNTPAESNARAPIRLSRLL